MEIFVNGKYFTKLDLKDGWEKYVLSVPASFWQDGENAIGFRYGWLASPEEVSQSPDPRYLAVAFDYVAVKQK